MDDVLVERRGSAAWVTLNRPAVRNALSRDVNLRLGEIAADLANDDDVRVAVITGAGDQAFCAGADLKERRGVPAGETGPFINAIAGAINGWAELRKPTIAAMNGSAYGGGLELALACDFRILVEGAELGLTEVRLGIMPGAGGTQRLPRLIGEARAKEMILLGRRIGAARALEIGLVGQLVPRAELAEKKFLATYLRLGILQDNPFEIIDVKGVGRLMETAIMWARRNKKGIEIGVCGEHGGEPRSIRYFHQIGIDYVSCSAFRIPVARLVAAQAALQDKSDKPAEKLDTA